jgi:hypothetical protein
MPPVPHRGRSRRGRARRTTDSTERAPFTRPDDASLDQLRQQRGRRKRVAGGKPAFVDEEHATGFGCRPEATRAGLHRSAMRSLWTGVESVDRCAG